MIKMVNVMATIISTHIRNSGSNVPAVQLWVSGPDIFRPKHWQTPVRPIACASCHM